MFRQSDDASSEDIARTFRLPSGIGATCVLHSPFNEFKEWDFKSQGNLQSSFYDSMCLEVFTPGIPFDSSGQSVPVPVSGSQRERLHKKYYNQRKRQINPCFRYRFQVISYLLLCGR